MITPDRRFDPSQVSVNRGQAVQWRNGSRSPQTVTDDPVRIADKSKIALPPGAEPIDSGVINPGDTFVHSFSVAGDYQYLSLPFEAQNMIGRVTVQG
jgi:plastocyanin